MKMSLETKNRIGWGRGACGCNVKGKKLSELGINAGNFVVRVRNFVAIQE